MPLAAPLILPFAELAGITIAGLGMAAASKKVSDFISDNPETSTQILTMLVPGGQGLNALFKKKASVTLEDIEDMTDEEAQNLSKEDKAEIMKEVGKSKGGDKRQRMIEISEKLGLSGEGKEKQKIFDEVEERYDEGGVEDAPKPKFDYKKFFRNRNADGGAIGIEVLFEEKKDGGRIGFANGGENIIGADLKDERPFYQQVIEDKLIDVIPDDIAKAHGKAMYTPQGIANTSNSIRDYHIAANADLSNRISNKIGENYGNIAQTAYNIAAPALSIPASLGYDYSQAQSRMEPGSGIKGLAKAFMDEAPFSAAYQRAIGAAAPLAEQSSNVLNKISDFFFAPAGAAEISPTTNRNFDRDFSQLPSYGDAVSRTNVQGMDLEMDSGAFINPNIQQSQNMFQRFGGAVQDGIGSLQDVAGKGIDLGKMAMSGIGNAIMPGLGFVGNLFSGIDRFDTLSPEDQAFILDQAGGNQPSKDRYGINRRSAFGNYAQYVRDKGIFAPGKRGEYYRSLNIPGLDTAMKETVAREQRAKRAYEKQIRDAADAAAREQARIRSITAGYGGSDDSRGATGPTASGAGMGVGGGYASDYGFAKGGLATMFVEKR